jgi:D-proline reductase (dithiol) PrdB
MTGEAVVTPGTAEAESFAEFRDSFSYGARNDLNFKFLSKLSAGDAARFFQDLLWKLGDAYDDGDFDRLIQHAFEWQARAYDGPGSWTYDDGPFTPLPKPVSDSRLALLTSSGHFVEGDDPEPLGVKNMTQEEAAARIGEFLKIAPQLSSIPLDTPRERLRVRHGGYDIRGSQADPNVSLPIERLRELVKEGVIGALAPQAYSFVGATAQTPLLKESGPQWVEMLRQQQVDAALLVPV